MTKVKLCETCSFYDEIAPKDDIDSGDADYDLGLCCIKRDRLPLWIKDCACDTFVHGDWADCPTWTADAVMVPEPAVVSTHPRYLPIGSVIWGNGIIQDQFAAVLDFAERHASLINEDDLHIAQDYGRLFLGQHGDQDAEALGKLFDALNRACPPFCFFGSHPGNGSDIGVWPNEDEIGEALMAKTLVRVNHWLDVENTSPTWEFVLVQSPKSDHMELFERAKGVQGRVWKV